MLDFVVRRPLHDLQQRAILPDFCAVAQFIPQCLSTDHIIERCISTLRMVVSRLDERAIECDFVTIESLKGIALIVHFTSSDGYRLDQLLLDEPFLHVLNSASFHKLLTFLEGDLMGLNYVLLSVRRTSTSKTANAKEMQRCNAMCAVLATFIESLQPAIRLLGVENPYAYQTTTKDRQIHHCLRSRIFTSHDLESLLYRAGYIQSIGFDMESRRREISIFLLDILAKKFGTDTVSDVRIFSRTEEEAIQSKKASVYNDTTRHSGPGT